VQISDGDIGQNIQRARYLRGLTQLELAAAVGLDRTAVSRIEAGSRSLAAVELVIVAEVLAVPMEELLKAAPRPSRSRDLGRMLMRTGPATSNDELQLGWFVEMIELAEGAAALSSLLPIPRRLYALTPEVAGELGARWTRRALGLGPAEPIASISGLLYRSGVMVATARMPSASRLAGCALVMPSGLYGIFVNANHPPSRQRFTALHELAHLLFDAVAGGAGTSCDAGEVRPGPRSPAEARADAFAGAFLLPKRAVLGWLGAELSLDRLRAIEIEFSVSHAATIRRLRELHSLTDEQARVLRKLGGGTKSLGASIPFRLVGDSLARLVGDEGSRRSGAEHGYEVRRDEAVLP
jgi:Zn-dependent peptidase ImmA (M78 family)/transcriptional regulator with XRE-family HTH domain